MDPEQQVQALDAEYAPRIQAAADDAAKKDLMLERETKKSEVWQSHSRTQQVAGWKTAALAQFPRAPQSAISGATEEEVLASAKELHDHYESELAKDRERIQQQVESDARQRMYGRPNAGGGGGDGSLEGGGGTQGEQHAFDRVEERIKQVAQAHISGQGVGPVSGAEHDKFIQGVGDILIQRQITGILPDGLEERRTQK